MADVATTVARWKASAGTAQQRFTEGVQGTTVDVVSRAIAAQPKLVQGFAESVNSGRWARALSEVGTQGWKQATLAKANNYSVGIQAGEAKYQRAMTKWLPITASISQQVQAMPNATFADSLARMTAFSTAMHNAKLQG